MNTYFFYKIHNPNLPYCYIGRTRDPRARLATHKSKTPSSEFQIYKTIRENGGWTAGWRFEVIETCDMTTEDSMKKERELYETHNANLNMLVPDNNTAAYSYYQKHKDTLRVKAREKYQKTKTEWKHPRLSTEDKKTLTLRKAKNYGHIPTQFTMEKHGITQEELEQHLGEGGWLVEKI